MNIDPLHIVLLVSLVLNIYFFIRADRQVPPEFLDLFFDLAATLAERTPTERDDRFVKDARDYVEGFTEIDVSVDE